MGSSNSRLDGSPTSGSRSGTSNKFKRRVLASLFCGASVSHAPIQMADHVDESLTGSLENLSSCHDESSSPPLLTFGLENGLTSFSTGSGDLRESTNGNAEDTSTSKNIKLPCQQININGGHMETHEASNSIKELPSTTSVSADTTDAGFEDQDARSLRSGGEPISDARMDFSNTNSGIPLSLVSSPQLPEFLVSDREREVRAARVLVVDVVSINSNILSSSFSEISNREARRNSRRMFWDAFSRSNLRQNRDSSTLVFTTSHTDDLGSHDRWLLDFSGNLHYDGVGSESRYTGTRNRLRGERRWQSRYGMSERFHDDQSWRTSLCPTGLHSNGTCSCESSAVSEDLSSHSGVSQIIMLADALFEVLGEIHRHHLSFSPSMPSLPASEAVVNSFPLKNHKKLPGTEGGTQDTEQCHICLVDYEEGDEIRVLPCSHEYHMSCVDKWLKEIHGVCPLCRDDVCKSVVESSASNPEIESL